MGAFLRNGGYMYSKYCVSIRFLTRVLVTIAVTPMKLNHALSESKTVRPIISNCIYLLSIYLAA